MDPLQYVDGPQEDLRELALRVVDALEALERAEFEPEPMYQAVRAALLGVSRVRERES